MSEKIANSSSLLYDHASKKIGFNILFYRNKNEMNE